MAYIPEPTRFTNFDETVTAERVSVINYKPTWGPSVINYDITEVSGGYATSSLVGGDYEGAIQLGTGTNTAGSSEIQTKIVGQYQAGNQAEVGWGVIIPTNPTGSQYGEWSYSTNREEGGFGWGVDTDGAYIYYINKGTKRKVRQNDWNVNTLSGSLDLSAGLIFQCEFTWYGFGPIKYYLQDRLGNDQVIRTLVHIVDVTGSLSTSDPNQPIRFNVKNGGSTSSDFNMYVAGHQFSIIAGDKRTRTRPVSIDTGIIELQNTVEYQPVAIVRKKPTFRGKENSVNATVKTFQGVCSANATFRLASAPAEAITNATWSEVPGWGNESAVQIATSSAGNPLISSGSRVFPAAHRFVTAGGREEGVTLGDTEDLLLGSNSVGVVYVKLDVGSVGETSKVAFGWQEEW